MSTLWAIVKDVVAWLWAFLSQPRLELYFDPSQTYHVVPDQSFRGKDGMFLHVMVVNRGRAVARQCRGILAEVHEEQGSGAFAPASLFRNPVELHWAHEPLDCFAKDIPSHEPTRLDVCFAHEGNRTLHFFCEKRPRGIQTDFPPGRYEIKIRVRSEEGTTCSRDFLITWDGNFRKLYMEQLRT